MINATQLKVGNIVMYNAEPHRITKLIHITPGNWRGMVQTQMVNLRNGNRYEYRYRSDEKVEVLTLETHPLKYMYRQGDDFHFMNTETYDIMTLTADVLGDAVQYMIEELEVTAHYYGGAPVSIEVPNFVVLKIAETEPTLKGATVTSSPKRAVTDTGLEIRVPQFIDVGDSVRIDTRDGSFVERA
ncbi:MAG: elongation factor P [Candidatus Eisenbacteria bacterium]|nr:elongation factor P [Candidatus Eisenbacteria bacterium]